MKRGQLIYICGDTHAEWDKLNVFINKKIRSSRLVRSLADDYDEFEVLMLICGDFGYWPHLSPPPEDLRTGGREDRWDQYGIKNQVDFIKDGLVKIYWADGNHENHDRLDELEAINPDKPFIEIMPGVSFATFGSVLRLADGTNVLFAGGAESTDKGDRTPGITWWQQETIDDVDMAKLPDPHTTKIDWVISHTCPHSFVLFAPSIAFGKNRDPSKEHLERILDAHHPQRWWFGHYHHAQSGHNAGCRWSALDYIGNYKGRQWVDTVLVEG